MQGHSERGIRGYMKAKHYDYKISPKNIDITEKYLYANVIFCQCWYGFSISPCLTGILTKIRKNIYSDKSQLVPDPD